MTGGVPLRVVVVDDEPLIREGLAELLAAEAGVEVVATCGDGEAALAALRAHAPDVCYLDVHMPGMDGLAVARTLAREASPSPPPAIVFATAHDRYALAAFEVSAVDYLLKPFDAARVRASVARVRERLAHGGTAALAARLAALLARLEAGGEAKDAHVAENAGPASGGASAATPAAPAFAERLLVGVARGTRVVPVKEIEWIEAADNYVTVHASDGSGLLREPLKSLEARLDPARFARVHRSALVNLSRVRELRPLPSGDWVLTLRSGATVPLSRTHREAVLKRLG